MIVATMIPKKFMLKALAICIIVPVLRGLSGGFDGYVANVKTNPIEHLLTCLLG